MALRAARFVRYKHQFLFVYVPRYETGGSLFPLLSEYTLTGLQVGRLARHGVYGM
jgi:hypothetical protein